MSTMKMYGYIVLDISKPWDEFLESIFEFSHLLIREWIKALSTNLAICGTFSVEMHCDIVCDSSFSYKKCLKSIFRFSHLMIRGLIKRLNAN